VAKTLEAHLRGDGGSEPQTVRDAFIVLLKGDVLPHVSWRSATLMRSSMRWCGKYRKATRIMIVD
jgi:hypothetical protein